MRQIPLSSHYSDMTKSLIRAKAPTMEWVERRIFTLKKGKGMLSSHLAELYEVEPRVLIQAVKRNLERFPRDFMFQVTAKEWSHLKSQIVISSSDHGGLRRALPYVFTEQGVAMLSSVLNTPRAIQVNVTIMRTFVSLRHESASREEVARRLAALEQRYDLHDSEIQSIFESIREMMAVPEKKTRRIGY